MLTGMPSTLIQISAVIEIEAAQKILIGFAFAGMLGHDQARHHLQRPADARERPGVHLRAADGHGAGGGGMHVRRSRGRRPRRHAAADMRWNGRAWLSRGWISRGSLATRRSGPLARLRFGRIYGHRGKLAGRNSRDTLRVGRWRQDHQ
jgi:hypothetical protein